MYGSACRFRLAHELPVNDRIVALDYVLRESDRVANKIHRHEPPVTDMPIKIVHRDKDFLVVDKPGSIPVSLMLLYASF